MRKMILLEAESFLTSFFKKAITLHINKQSFHSVTRSRHAQLFKGKKMQEKGIKHDNGKPRPDLIFSAMARALLEVSKVAAMGAAKYDDDNWLIVEDASKRYRDAKGRHLLLGAIEPHDNESNITHLAHEAWNALAVLELHLRKLEEPRQVAANWPASADERMLPIMQNGNEGEHYEGGLVWIEHNGGSCPVPPDTCVDVQLRDGRKLLSTDAIQHTWNHSRDIKEDFQITHYRIVDGE